MERSIMKRKRAPFILITVVSLILSLTTFSPETIGQETSAENTSTKVRSKVPPLLERILVATKDVEFFSLSMFIDLYQDDLKLYDWGPKPQDYIYLAATYTRVRSFDDLYESAVVADRKEIVDCLNAFDQLSRKEKAFVLGATALYIYRSEDSKAVEALPENKRVEPLSQEEKLDFSKILQSCAKDDEIAFEAISGTLREWDGDFRENVFSLKERLGANNRMKFFSAFDDETGEKWRRNCFYLPINSVFYNLGAIRNEANNSKISLLNTGKTEFNEFDIREIDLAKHYFFLQYGCMSMTPEPWGHNVLKDENGPSRSLFDEVESAAVVEPNVSEDPDAESPIGPNPDNLPYRVQIGPQSLAKMANRVLNMFPELKVE
ncbi:MAG: hypothetical protein J6X44_08875 [Thermoguttaceae bacterium]|nr:hypothetical protein [Thermoguttaceae bacterium]